MSYIVEESQSLIEMYSNDDPDGMRAFEEEEAVRQQKIRNREIMAGSYENLRIVLYEGDCVVLYLNDVRQTRFVVRHPKLRYVISQMR